MEDDVVVEIQDEQSGRKGFSLFRRNEGADKTASSEPDMKVPFNNRSKNKIKLQKKAEKEKEETLIIEDNLDKEAGNESVE